MTGRKPTAGLGRKPTSRTTFAVERRRSRLRIERWRNLELSLRGALDAERAEMPDTGPTRAADSLDLAVADDGMEDPPIVRRTKAKPPAADVAPAIPLALRALGIRAFQQGEDLFLDGRRVQLGEIIRAAIDAGGEIYYPGIRPAPKAYHSGPSLVLDAVEANDAETVEFMPQAPGNGGNGPGRARRSRRFGVGEHSKRR